MRLINLGAESKIRQLDAAFQRQQDIVRLDVAMDDALGMQKLQAMKSLSADRRDLALRHHVECHHIGQTATFHVLHDHPQIPFDEEAVHEIDHVLMLAVLHDQDFVDDQILLGLLLQVHLLDGHTLIRPDFKGRVHTTRSSLADFDEIAVFFSRIGRITDMLELIEDFRISD